MIWEKEFRVGFKTHTVEVVNGVIVYEGTIYRYTTDLPFAATSHVIVELAVTIAMVYPASLLLSALAEGFTVGSVLSAFIGMVALLLQLYKLATLMRAVGELPSLGVERQRQLREIRETKMADAIMAIEMFTRWFYDSGDRKMARKVSIKLGAMLESDAECSDVVMMAKNLAPKAKKARFNIAASVIKHNCGV